MSDLPLCLGELKHRASLAREGGFIFLLEKSYDGFLVIWCNFKFEGVLFTIPAFPENECMPDCLCRPTGSTSFRTQITDLICPKFGTDQISQQGHM